MPVYGASPPPGGWNFDAPPETDAGTDAARDASRSADATPFSCYEPIRAGTDESGEPALHQNKATAADIEDFFAACFDAAATAATCNAYVGTQAAPRHTEIVNCVYPVYNPALTIAVLNKLPPAVFIEEVTHGIALNVKTCRALAVGAPAGCAQSYTDSSICISRSCDSCPHAYLGSCVRVAGDTGCAPYVPNPACAVALVRQAGAADALCGPATIDYADSAKFKAAYTRIAQAMCGE